MQEEKFHGNEVALSVACNAFEDVLEGNNRVLVIRGAMGVGKTSLMARLRTKLSSPGMLERFSSLSGRTLKEGFINFATGTDHPSLPQDGYSVIFVDDIQDFDDRRLASLREYAEKLASSSLHFLLVLAYSSDGIKSQSAMMLPTLSNIKSTFAHTGIDINDIEVKPMTLADIATMLADTMSPNTFESNLANKLHSYTGGIQLLVNESIAYLRESGALHKDSDGKWSFQDNDTPLWNLTIYDIEEQRINLLANIDPSSYDAAARLLKLCKNRIKHNIVKPIPASQLVTIATRIAQQNDDPRIADAIAELQASIKPYDNNTQKEHRTKSLILNAGNIDRADELLKPLAQKYQMPQILENVQYMLDTLADDDYSLRITALTYKCEALVFLGMYNDADETAIQLCSYARQYGNPQQLHTALYWVGYTAGLLQRYDISDQYLDEATELAQKSGDRQSASIYLSCHAGLMNEHPDPTSGERLARHALLLSATINDKKSECAARIAKTQSLKALYKMDEAWEEARCTLNLLDAVNDPRTSARAYLALGALYQNDNNNDQASLYFSKAEQLMTQIYDNPGLINIKIHYGHLLCDSGNYDAAINQFDNALSNAKSLNILSKMLNANIGLGSAYLYKGNISQSERHYNEAMAIAQQIGSKNALSYAYASLGEYHQQSGEYEEALSYYQKTLELDRLNNDPINVYCDLINIASMCSFTDRIEEGIQYLEEAEKMPVEHLKKAMTSNVANTFGGLYVAKGEYQNAIDNYQKALDEDLRRNDLVNASISYGNISGTYTSLGEYEKAEQMAEKAIEIDRQLNDNLQLANHLARQASNYQAQSKLAESRDLYMESARLFQKINILDDAAKMLSNAAAIMHDLGDTTAASRTLHDAMSALEEIGNYDLQPSILRMLAILASEDERDDEAITIYKKAIDMYSEHDLERDDLYCDIMQTIAELHLQAKRNTEAVECYESLADTFADDDPDFCLENLILAGKTYMRIPDNLGAAKKFDKAFHMLDKIQNQDIRAAAESDIGDFLCWQKKFDEGIAFKIMAINHIKDTTTDQQLLARMYYTLAEREHECKRYNDAINSYLESQQLYHKINDKWQEAFVFNNIGFTYDTIGQLSKACKYYHQAYNCYKAVNDLDGMYNNLNNEALMYEKLGRTNEAAICYRTALDLLNIPMANPIEVGHTAFNLAKCLMNNSSEDAEKYFNTAYAKYREADSLDDMLSCIDTLAYYYTEKNNIQSARSCINIVQSMSDSKKSHEAQVKIYNTIGSIYTSIGEATNAIEYFYKSIRILAERDQWDDMAHCHFLMATKLMHNEDTLNDAITVKDKTQTISAFCMEYLDFAIKTAEKEDDQALMSDSLSTRALLHWNNSNFPQFESDMQTAISKATQNEARLSLMLHYGVLQMMRKEYHKAENQFLDTYDEACRLTMHEEQIQAKTWLCFLYYETGDIVKARIALGEIGPEIEYSITKVPGLAEYIVKR